MVDRRKEGRERADKLLKKSGYGDSGSEGALSSASGKKGGKWGPARFANGGVVEEVVEGDMPSGRLDKGRRGKRNGKTTVNVIVGGGKPGGAGGLDNGVPDNPEQAFQAGVQAGIKQASAPPPAPPAPPGPPPGMGAPPPGGPPMMPPPGMKKGGRVKMDAGAGGGEGRLEKSAKAARAKNKMINPR